MTGDVFPITRKVLKFTETEIRQDRTMKNCNHIVHRTVRSNKIEKCQESGSHILQFSPALEGCI